MKVTDISTLVGGFCLGAAVVHFDVVLCIVGTIMTVGSLAYAFYNDVQKKKS